MAKSVVQSAVSQEVAPPQLSAKVTRQIDAIRGSFSSYVRDFTALVERRAELAPKFMKAFGAYQAETGMTFVSFCRQLDPTIPEAQKEYRNHRAYQAAEYLRRLVARAAQKRTAAEEGETSTRPIPPMDALARFLASIIPSIADPSKLWSVLETECHWSDRQVNRLKTVVEQSHPLIHLQGVKNARIRIEHAASEGETQLAAAS